MPVSLTKARVAKAKVAKIAAGDANIVGVGLTKSGEDYAVKVNMAAAATRALPKTINGVPVVCDVVGRIQKQAVPPTGARGSGPARPRPARPRAARPAR